MKHNEAGRRRSDRFWQMTGNIFERKAGMIIAVTLILSLLMVGPLLFMAPDERVTGNPEDRVFDLYEKVEDRMPSAYKYTGFIIEARDGDILTQRELWELYQAEEDLRSSEIGSKYLINRYDVTFEKWIPGIYSIADEVNRVLLENMNTSLEFADDQQVKFAVHLILSSPSGSEFINTLSEKATSTKGAYLGMEIDIWTSEALLIETFSDNVKIINQYADTLDGNNDDTIVKEYYDRELQEILRGDQETYELWAVAIDVGLEAEEEGRMSSMLMAVAVVMIIILITVLFRSPRVSLLTTVGLGLMLLWWKGISNLVGIKGSLTVDILVPVSMMVLGVDYLIHAMHRYEEERSGTREPRKAMGLSIAGVGSALFLAMVTTVVAFASNATSEIDEIRGFGMSASISIISAFWIMGFFIPAVKMLWDQRRFSKGSRIGGRKKDGKGSTILGNGVAGVSKLRALVIPAVLLLSIGAGFFATQLEAKLDVKEYFDPSSDFVVSLDKLGEHVKERGGEQIIFYIEGDLEDPEVMASVIQLEEELDENEMIARDPITGEVQIYMDMITPLQHLFDNPYALNATSYAAGIEITDENNDSIPDTREQLRAVLHTLYENGMPYNDELMIYEPEEIRERLWISEDGDEYATVVMSGIPDTREIESVRDGEKELREDIEVLENAQGIEDYGLTGPPLFRERQLTAITESLTLSIGVAILLCFIVLVILFRSFKFALVTVIPEVLVAVWLYAVMFLLGYHLNAVTATIAAISIGVGIDYSVHVTARFREELKRLGSKEEAMREAASHTGVALFGSAASTMVGFAIIAFAPMPMFSSFGILTALMILMALVASLFVLPSLLLFVTRNDEFGTG